MDPVVHFELPAKDRKRIAKFYSNSFGWKANQLGEEMGNYITVMTTETDQNRMPLKPGAINGGIYEINNDKELFYPSIVIAVEDINKSIEKVRKEGGKIQGNIQEIPGVGKFISIIDTEENRISILEPLMK